MVAPGRRGVGFGCGTEWLPAVPSGRGCAATATDLPADHRDAAAWRDTGQHGGAPAQFHHPAPADRATFERLLSYRPVDMTAVLPDLLGHDVGW